MASVGPFSWLLKNYITNATLGNSQVSFRFPNFALHELCPPLSPATSTLYNLGPMIDTIYGIFWSLLDALRRMLGLGARPALKPVPVRVRAGFSHSSPLRRRAELRGWDAGFGPGALRR